MKGQRRFRPTLTPLCLTGIWKHDLSWKTPSLHRRSSGYRQVKGSMLTGRQGVHRHRRNSGWKCTVCMLQMRGCPLYKAGWEMVLLVISCIARELREVTALFQPLSTVPNRWTGLITYGEDLIKGGLMHGWYQVNKFYHLIWNSCLQESKGTLCLLSS